MALTKLTCLEKGSTVNVGKISGGIGANTISPSAEVIVEARFSQREERDRLLAQIKAIVNTRFVDNVTATLSGGLQRDVMQPSDAQSEFLRHLVAIIDEPLTTEQRGGVSDANVVAAAGTATLDGFGPFGDGAHTVYERACKKSFLRRVNLVSKILCAYNGVKTNPSLLKQDSESHMASL